MAQLTNATRNDKQGSPEQGGMGTTDHMSPSHVGQGEASCERNLLTRSQGAVQDAMSPFMRTPLEIRNQIYEYLLSTKHTKVDFLDEEPGYVLGWPLRARRVYHFHPTILVTNHQINQEASQILRDNLFVKLTNIVTGHGIAFELEGLPVVAENELASRITCSVIELSLVINNGATYEPWSSTSVFAGDDINTFCRVLLRSSLQSSLSIAVALDAQSTTSSLKLLEPFHRLHSLETANITGQLSNDYKSGLIASLLRQAPGFDTVIQEVKNTIREGDQAGTDKDYPTAIARYKKALEDNEDCRKFAAHDVKCGRFQKVYHRAVYMGMALALNEKLALTYLESKNYSRAHKWAKSGLLLINPFSEEMKLFARFESLAAQASEALGLLGRAAEEMADAVCYDPEDSKMAAELARLKLKIQSGHGDLAGA